MSKVYKYIIPKSDSDSSYEDFEYLLRWIGRDGAEYLYLFYDAEINQVVENEVINQEDSDNIESLISQETKEVEVFVDDLSLNDLKVIGEMFANKYVTRVRKDESEERFALGSNKLKYRKMQGRYEVSISLVAANLPNIK